MKRINIFLLGLCCLIGLKFSWAQELKCDVRVNANQVAGTDKTVYDNYKLQRPGRTLFLKFRFLLQ